MDNQVLTAATGDYWRANDSVGPELRPRQEVRVTQESRKKASNEVLRTYEINSLSRCSPASAHSNVAWPMKGCQLVAGIHVDWQAAGSRTRVLALESGV